MCLDRSVSEQGDAFQWMCGILQPRFTNEKDVALKAGSLNGTELSIGCSGDGGTFEGCSHSVICDEKVLVRLKAALNKYAVWLLTSTVQRRCRW